MYIALIMPERNPIRKRHTASQISTPQQSAALCSLLRHKSDAISAVLSNAAKCRNMLLLLQPQAALSVGRRPRGGVRLGRRLHWVCVLVEHKGAAALFSFLRALSSWSVSFDAARR